MSVRTGGGPASVVPSFYGPHESFPSAVDDDLIRQCLAFEAEADMLSNIDFDGVDADLLKFQRDDMVQEALAKGVDLREYSQQIEQNLDDAEHRCVQEYLEQAEDLAEVHSQIKLCDTTLEKMEVMLSAFQQDLGVISDEIQFLQDKSMTLSIQLQNRKAAENKVSKFVRHAYIAPDLMNIILREGSEHAEALNAALAALSEKLFFHQVPDVARTYAAKDTAPALSHLFAKAAARVRANLLNQIRALRQPKTSIQARQAVLLKDAPAYSFLLTHCSAAGLQALTGGGGDGSNGSGSTAARAGGSGFGASGGSSGAHGAHANGGNGNGYGNGEHGPVFGMGLGVASPSSPLPGSASSYLTSPSTLLSDIGALALSAAGHPQDLAGEVRRVYADTLTGLYTAQFKAYLASMKKLEQESRVKKEDLLASEQGGKIGGIFGLGKKSADDLMRVFAIGQRELVLTSLAKDSIVLHVAAKSGMGFPFERLFRSAHQLLVDTVSTEMDFMWSFFGQGKGPADEKEQQGQGQGQKQPASPTRPSWAAVVAAAGGDKNKGDDDDGSDGESDMDDYLAPIVRAASASVSARTGDGSSNPPPPPSRLVAPGAKRVSFTRRVIGDARARGRKVATALQPLRTHHVYGLFSQIFTSVLNAYMEHLEDYLFTCFDSVGVLILIRMVALNNQQMQERNITVLDSFFDRLNIILWAKFKSLFDANFNSLAAARTSATVKRGALGVHFVVQRYAEYAAALRRLNYNFRDEIIEVGLSRMARVIEGVIKTLAASAAPGSGIANDKAQLAFCINNYDVIVRTFHSKALSESPEAFLFADLMTKASADLVEAELTDKFSEMIAFVKAQEARLHGGGAAVAPVPDDVRVERLVRGFVATWRAALESVHTTLVGYFARAEQPLAPAPAIASPMAALSFNTPGGATAQQQQQQQLAQQQQQQMSALQLGVGPSVMTAEESAQAQALALMGVGSDTGSEVLKKCLLQLVLYYKRFQDVLSKVYQARQPSFLRDMIPVQTILYEIKKLGARGTPGH
jgi:hypothetical protein